TVQLGIGSQAAWNQNGHGVAQLKNLRVLLVDDNATNRLILSEILDHHGLCPQAASSADEALHLLRRSCAAGQPFSLLVTDVNMPDIDGFTLVKQVRQDKQLRDLAVIVLTSGD